MKKSKIIIILCLLLTSLAEGMAQDDMLAAPKITVKGVLENPKLKNTVELNVNSMFKAMHEALLNGNTPMLPEKVMDKECQQELMELWRNSQISCPQSEVEAPVVKIYNPNPKDKKEGILEVRDIPILQERALDEPQTLNVMFNARGIICGLSIGLDMNFRNISSRQDEGIDAVRKQIINSFLENFRTAYNRRDISYLEKIYSNDALIITGRMVTPKVSSSGSDDKTLKVSQEVEFLKQTKQEYINRLRGVFQKNDYINVDFENVDIHKHPNAEFAQRGVYCVSLDQSWTSASTKTKGHYHDDGYLFLMIDFHDQDKPLIQIRVWQPQESLAKKNKINEYNVGEFN